MKFAIPKRFEHDVRGVLTTTDCITLKEIEQFHKPEFFEQFKKFAANLKTTTIKSKEGEIEAYYYADYQFVARRTELFLNPI